MCKCLFSHIGLFISPSRGSFLVLSAPGHTGSPPEHHGASFGPWPRSVARAMGVQSCQNWRVTTRRGGIPSTYESNPGPCKPTYWLKKMSDGLRMSFRILVTTRTDCLPTSCSCSSARVLVLVLECSFFGLLERASTCTRKHIFMLKYFRERCLHFRPLVDWGQYLLNSRPCFT